MRENNFEIERKWLIDKNKIDYDLKKFNFNTIEQCYISKSPTVRIRKIDNNYILTFKKDLDSDRIKRYEYEINLSKNQYYNLKNLTISNIIYKKRYKIPYGKYYILLDVFLKKLKGLVLAEVEFSSVNLAKTFIAPEWFGKDVTNKMKYTNLNLSFKKNL